MRTTRLATRFRNSVNSVKAAKAPVIALTAATGIVLGAVGRVAWAAVKGQIFQPE